MDPPIIYVVQNTANNLHAIGVTAQTELNIAIANTQAKEALNDAAWATYSGLADGTPAKAAALTDFNSKHSAFLNAVSEQNAAAVQLRRAAGRASDAWEYERRLS